MAKGPLSCRSLMTNQPSSQKRWFLPVVIYVVCTAIYLLVLGARVKEPSPDNHYVYLAESMLHGELGVVGNKPPGYNDWAFYNGRWYVSFPPFPAFVIMPVVAIFHLATLDRLFWTLIAGFAPAFIFMMLRHLRDSGHSDRSEQDDLLLTGLFAFCSVFFFCAVQGTVWFAAQVVASSLLALYVMFAADARRPILAGTMLGFLFMTRPTTLLAAVFFGVEALRYARKSDAPEIDSELDIWTYAVRWVKGVDWKIAIRKIALFSVPILVVGGITMALNIARFDHPLEFGHRYLQIRWAPRIEKWGLFNFHFMGKNLAVFLAAMPWLSATAPYVMISRHGLALWVTTPHYFQTLWPKRITSMQVGLFAAAGLVCLYNLCYQNSGWVQFGYRFSLDYAPFLIALLALGNRRFGPVFRGLMIFAFVVNAFGALTFDREWQYYDNDNTQNVIFQPD